MTDTAHEPELELRPWLALNDGSVCPHLPYRITDGMTNLGYFRTAAMGRAALEALAEHDRRAVFGGPAPITTADRVDALAENVGALEAKLGEAVYALSNRIEAVARVLGSRAERQA